MTENRALDLKTYRGNYGRGVGWPATACCRSSYSPSIVWYSYRLSGPNWEAQKHTISGKSIWTPCSLTLVILEYFSVRNILSKMKWWNDNVSKSINEWGIQWRYLFSGEIFTQKWHIKRAKLAFFFLDLCENFYHCGKILLKILFLAVAFPNLVSHSHQLSKKLLWN